MPRYRSRQQVAALNLHTWFCSLLPYIEQQPAYDRLDFTKKTNVSPNQDVLLGLFIPGVSCPSDVHAGLDENWPSSGYRPGGKGTYSMGANYSPCGGPISNNGCPIAAMSPNINCNPRSRRYPVAQAITAHRACSLVGLSRIVLSVAAMG